MKTLFIFQVQSFTDVVTNSSSELFVFNGSTKTVEELLNFAVPGWKSEYNSPVTLQEIDDDSFNMYLNYAYDNWDNHYREITKANSKQLVLARTFKIDPKLLYKNYDEWDPNSKDWTKTYLELSKEGLQLIKSKLPSNLIFVFSKDDNPNWDRQKIMMNYGIRYHLG